jgi:hypothetical protein
MFCNTATSPDGSAFFYGDNKRKEERVMKKLLVSTVAATMLVAAVPAFAASPSEEADQGIATYPPVGQCHFVLQRTMTPNGHVVLQRQQVCE